MRIMEDSTEWYDVPKQLEAKYGVNHIEDQIRYGQAQPFFRGNKFASDLIKEFKEEHLAQLRLFDDLNEYEDSCKESCEPI